MNNLLDIEYAWNTEEDSNCRANAFDIHRYASQGQKVAMHCSKLEQAEIFAQYLDKYGYSWCTGEAYTHNDRWTAFNQDTCYNFVQGTYDNLEYFISNGFEILEFSDFNWEGFDE